MAKSHRKQSSLPISGRGRSNIRPDLMIDLSREMEQNGYDRTLNPDGIIDMGSAINDLMLDVLTKHLQKQLPSFEDVSRYNSTLGSDALLSAATDFLNFYFKPRQLLSPGNLLATNGVTAALDALAFNLLDEGDVILMPTPSYGMLVHDLSTRNGISVVSVPCDDIDQFSTYEELLFRLKTAQDQEIATGHKVGAVLICNPNNPLGMAYHPKVLLAIAKFCEENRLHLVSDEIYGTISSPAFHSILSVDLPNPKNVHVLWGVSKDFGLGGLRLGFLVTTNSRLYAAMRTLSMFTWVSAYTAYTVSMLLENRQFLQDVYFPTLYSRMRERRDQIADYLSQLEIPYTKADGGIYFFIDLSRWLQFAGEKLSELNLLRKLMKSGVFLEPGSAFFSQRPGQFRLTYTGKEDTVRLGMQRLAKALHLLDGSTRLLESKEKPPKRRWCI